MTGRKETRASPAAAAALAILLAGCVVGPNYKGPPAVAARASAATGFLRADDATSEPPPARWWTALGDPRLNQLIDAALAASPDLEAAQARLRQSRAGLRESRANGLPTSSASALALRSKGLTSVLGGSSAAQAQGQPASDTLDIYSVGFDATWEIDLFGGNRRAVEGARANAEAYRADLQGAYVSLTADVAQAYVSLRAYQARLALSRRDADVQRRLLELTIQRREGGTASDLDVERLNSQLQSTRADFEPLQARITDQLDRLALLTGREPGAWDQMLASPAPAPVPPVTVAVGDPAALLRRRPDVRAAERRLARQNALIAQRTADLFPKVTLLGDIGFTSTQVSRIFTSGALTDVAAPILQWSPLDFGRTRARIGEARAGRDEALADYRKAVLTALSDAESGLARYGRQRQAVASQSRVKASADRAAALTELRVKGGTASTIDVLDAEHRRAQAESALEQAQAELTQDYVSLQKSLGLGWSDPSLR